MLEKMKQLLTAFNIHVSNPKSIPVDLYFRKAGHSFNLYAKFTLMEQLSNSHTTNKNALKFRLKRREEC